MVVVVEAPVVVDVVSLVAQRDPWRGALHSIHRLNDDAARRMHRLLPHHQIQLLQVSRPGPARGVNEEGEQKGPIDGCAERRLESEERKREEGDDATMWWRKWTKWTTTLN